MLADGKKVIFYRIHFGTMTLVVLKMESGMRNSEVGSRRTGHSRKGDRLA